MTLETITLTPVTVLDETDPVDVGVPMRRKGVPISLRARVRDVSGTEQQEEGVRVDVHDTEFEVLLLPSLANVSNEWELAARGHSKWEIVRALRRPAPGAIVDSRLLILARIRR